MSMKILYNSPKGYRPKAGQLYFMHTSLGYIPVGVTSTQAFWGDAVMLHIYRALVQDISDKSFHNLIESNILLAPPVMIAKRDFKKGGSFTRIDDKNAPTPIPFNHYYKYKQAFTWTPEERAFAPIYPPLPKDRLGTFVPKDQRMIYRTVHDSNPPQTKLVHEVPPETWFMADMVPLDTHLEFALEDSLAFYDLINIPRPKHPNLNETDVTSGESCEVESYSK